MNGHARNFKDMTGQRFGRLLVLEESDLSENRTVIWKVKCDCGVEFDALGTNLRNGTTRSCGCLRREATAERNTRLKKGRSW